MQTMQNHLESFEIQQKKRGRDTIVLLCVGISIISNIMVIPGIALSYHYKDGFSEAIFSPVFYMQVLFSRAIPVLAVILFWLGKRFGWTLMIIVYLFDILQKGYTFLMFSKDFSFSSQRETFWTLSMTSTFLMSAILVWLLLAKSVLAVFNVNKSQILVSVATGITLFIVIRFIVAPFLIDFAKGRPITSTNAQQKYYYKRGRLNPNQLQVAIVPHPSRRKFDRQTIVNLYF